MSFSATVGDSVRSLETAPTFLAPVEDSVLSRHASLKTEEGFASLVGGAIS